MARRDPFRGHRFPKDVILLAVRWYRRYPLSYRDVREMLAERGITVDAASIHRWVRRFGPEIRKRALCRHRSWRGLTWHVDETYIRVNGRWCYLWRAVDQFGQLIDFRLTARRDAKAATAFLRQARETVRLYQPLTIITDKAPTSVKVIGEINDRLGPEDGVVDPAVIRPGRFDLKISVLNPDRSGIRDILADHLTLSGSSSLDDADLDAISVELVGSSGAAVAALAREAMSRARVEGRPVSPDDLFAVVRKGSHGTSSDYLKRLAVHEAGHVIVRALSNLPAPQSVRVGAGVAAVQNPGLPFLIPESAEEMLRDLLAGRAAERIVLGSISSGAGEGASSDLAQATALAAKMETEWAFSEGAPVWQSAATLMLFNLPNATRAAIEQRLMAAELAAEDMLRQHEDELMRLVAILLERRELAGSDLLGVLSDLGLSADRDALVSAPVG